MKLRGQTLIELLIAMTVIIVGLTAATTMIFYNIRLQERSSARVVAANLAREGMELAKAQRDSNWLAGRPFDEGLYEVGTNDFGGVPVIAGGQFDRFDFTPDLDFIFGAPIPPEVIIKRSSDPLNPQVFVQGSGTAGTDQDILRIMVFNPICIDGSVISGPEDGTCGALQKVGIHVISAAVTWVRDAGIVSIIEDDIYDWR